MSEEERDVTGKSFSERNDMSKTISLVEKLVKPEIMIAGIYDEFDDEDN